MVRVVLDEIRECPLVDPTDGGRDVVERVVATQLLAGGRPPTLVGQGLLGVVPLQRQRCAGSAPEGAGAFPCDSSDSGVGFSESST